MLLLQDNAVTWDLRSSVSQRTIWIILVAFVGFVVDLRHKTRKRKLASETKPGG
jgi:hypothetical protein